MTNPEKLFINVREALQDLAKDYTGMKKSAIFRNNYQDIENALKSGHSSKNIVELLNKNNIDISLNTFKKYLQRERKKNQKDVKSLLSESKEKNAMLLKNEEKLLSSNLVKEKSENEVETEPAKEWKSAYSKNDPRMIDEILRNSTDIDALAKEYREFKRNSKK